MILWNTSENFQIVLRFGDSKPKNIFYHNETCLNFYEKQTLKDHALNNNNFTQNT